MGFLDDLPKRSASHDTASTAETAFQAAIEQCKQFVVQSRDQNDYGTDIQIEARRGGAVTNLRVHVQLKGTDTSTNSDGSVSVGIARANLNYLLAQPDSIYVCYHLPSHRLLVRYAHDVYREYEQRGADWRQQDKLTVKFSQTFDSEFQRRLNARVMASGNLARDSRLEWAAAPPERVPSMVRQTIPDIEVPSDPLQAKALLAYLYEAGEDAVISKSFAKFAAVLDSSVMDMAYMAEINLGVNGLPFDEQRVRHGIQVLQDSLARGLFHPGSLLYCQGNAWLALREYEMARATYHAALTQLDDAPQVSAQCSKNMGSALAALGALTAARAFYERALELDPDLGEAHLALARWHNRNGDSQLALEYLDRVTPQKGSTLPMSNVSGFRIELLFKIGATDEAFREIQTLLGAAGRLAWVWPWCARQVAEFGRRSIGAAQKALRFWRSFLQEHPNNQAAQREVLLCLWYLRGADAPTGTDFEGFKLAAVRLIESGDPQSAFLWDRVGHWAQFDSNWMEAERAYRKAYEIEPERYGYCLGTALNRLGRHDDALPILIQQAERHQPDAMSWFQVAVARNGVGDIGGAIAAYQKALELNDGYDLAWFNLGGLYWNSGDIARAIATWREAIERFPDHALVKELPQECSFLFNEGETGHPT